jgi:peptidyl-prolyl cis-trans isomerase D
MRKHAGSWMIKVLLAAIVIVFIFWGVGSWTSQRQSRVAKVNGAWITVDEYKSTYDQLLGQVRQTFGNNLNDELLQSLNLRKRALDQLIDQALMMQAAENFKLKVSDEELAQSIRSIPAFQTAGVFDESRYINLLERNRLTRADFEESQRNSMQLQKLRAFITGAVKVSDQEAIEWFNWNDAQVSINYVLIEAKRFTDLEPTEEELSAYFEQNKNSYKTDPTVKVRYIVFKPEAYISGVDVSEEEILDYYETHLEEFKTPKTVAARHILIKVDQDASPEVVAKAKAKIENIHNLAKEVQDFAELAKQYSEGPTKDKGGYLGEFRKDAMVKPFADKAFSMKAGEISEPVRTRFGWHIIKVEKVNPASTASYEDAKSKIKTTLLNEKSKWLAQDEAEAAYDASYEGDDLDTIAAQRNLSILETDHFSQKGPDKGVQNPSQFASVAFNLPDNEISDVQDFGDGYYLMQVVEKILSKIPEIDIVKDQVRKDWIKAEQNEMAKADANNLLTDLKNGLEFEAAAKKIGLDPKHTDFFKRSGSIPDIEYEPEINQVAFKLSEANKLPDEAIESQKGYYVIGFRGRQAPPAADFDKQKEELKKRLLQQKQFRIFDAWLLDTKSKAEISISREFKES